MWEPLLSKLRKDFYLESVINNYYDGFNVIIGDHDDKKKKIHIKFKFGVFCYRETCELFAFEMQKDFLQEGSSFYKVINSNYIQWLSGVSKGISDAMQPNMQHFVIFSEDYTLEILDSGEPEITFVDIE